MGNRLTKIYTRTGDDGTTALASGNRASKSDLIFIVMGDVDELNAHIGLISAFVKNANIANVEVTTKLLESLSIVQHLLFNVGGELAMPEYKGILESHLKWLESEIDDMNSELMPLKDFILPAGSVLVSEIHVSRTVCRRSERQAVKLKQSNHQLISENSFKLLNRLSDWLFVLARYCAKLENSDEVLWNKTILDKFD